MQVLNKKELQQFIKKHQVICGTEERPALMLTPDNQIVKAFYRRKRFSRSTFLPQAKRFVANCRKLLERNVRGPVAREVIYCPDIPVHMVVYERLEGQDLRELCAETDSDCLDILPDYLASLHSKGIYFRAIHLGNVLFGADDLAIIDVSDLRAYNSPLGIFQRARNLAHLLNTKDDKSYFVSYGVSRFVQRYERCAEFSGFRRFLFRNRLRLRLDSDVLDELAKQSNLEGTSDTN